MASSAVASYCGDGARMLLHNNSGCCLEDEYDDCRSRPSTGAFGVVRMVRSKRTHVICALKSISKARAQLPQLKREVEINLAIDHPNIARLYNVYEDANFVYMVLEVCKGGELLDAIIKRKQLSEVESVLVGRQMIWAVNYLHAKYIAHRDLKLENLLLKDKGVELSKNVVKLIDFGLASRFTPGRAAMKTMAGSAYYVAPEILELRSAKHKRYTEKVDIWSAGVVMYMLLCGSPPFPGNDEHEIMANVRSINPSYAEAPWQQTSAQARKLVQSMLTRDVDARVSSTVAVALCKDIPMTAVASSSVVETAAGQGKGFFERLKVFNMRSRFEQAARHLIARHVDEASVQGLREQFQRMDVNGDGMVSLEEAKATLMASGLKDGDMPAIEEFFRAADTDGSEQIDYTEFLAATMNQTAFDEGAVYEAFRVFDRDGDGVIGFEDLKEALGGHSDHPDSDSDRSDSTSSSPARSARASSRRPTVQDMLADADCDGDGKVDFNEFFAMVTKSPTKTPQRPLGQLGMGLLEFKHKL